MTSIIISLIAGIIAFLTIIAIVYLTDEKVDYIISVIYCFINYVNGNKI